MGYRSYTNYQTDSSGYRYVKSSLVADTGSTKDRFGKIHTEKQCALYWNKSDVVSYVNGDVGSPVNGWGAITPPGFTLDPIYNAARSRFYGKLRSGSASLGVTAASWRQSRDMITSRLNKTGRYVDNAIRLAERGQHLLQRSKRRSRRLRRGNDPLASAVLEAEFGWMPLFSDIHSALFTVCKPLAGTRITARQQSALYETVVYRGDPTIRQIYSGTARVTLSASCLVSNPNLALVNRLGLVNPAVVAWDLVPWSFVVNMFVNVNELLSSLTDEVGYDVTDRTRTDTVRTLTEVLISRAAVYKETPSSGSILRKRKTRQAVSAFAPSLTVKVPDFSWETALIAGSLLIQKINKLNRLLSL